MRSATRESELNQSSSESGPLKVLLICEDERDYFTTRSLLSEMREGEFDLEWARTPVDALKAIRSNAHNVCLLDEQFYAGRALQLFREARSEGDFGPVILLTEHDGREVGPEALDAGAVDYLNKRTVCAPLLERSLRYAMERANILATLSESEERYRRLVENANDIIYTHDLLGNFTSLNRAGEEITGYTREEACRMNMAQVVAPETVEIAHEMTTRKTNQGGATVYELEIISKSGRRLILELSTRLILEKGVPVGVQGIGRDVTERRRAEEALRRSEENYRSIFDNATMGIYQSSFDGTLLKANPTLARMLGYSSPDELLNLNMSEDIYWSREERETLVAAHEPMGAAIDLEVRWKKRDGTPIWVHLNSNAVKDEAGRTIFFNGIVHDVTLRKHVEESLRIKTQQLEGITAAMTASLEGKDRREVALMLLRFALNQTESECGFAGIVVDGPALHILAHEGAAWDPNISTELYESAREQYRKEGYIEVSEFNDLLGTVIKNGKAILSNQMDACASDTAPTRQPLRQFLAVPILIGGEVIGMIGVANRETDYTGTELTKLEILAQLAGVLFDNYRRLQREAALEEQLRQSQKIEAIGQLAGGVAHDFNNLLTAITGYSDLVMRRLPPEGVLRRHVAEIRKAGDRAASLTRQLLAFSRKQVLRPKVLDLNAVVTDMDKMLRRLIGEDIDLLTVTDRALGNVKADPGQIEQVILNLAVNARDAMPKGGKLTIETANIYLGGKYAGEHVAVRPGRYVMLAISDNGCGMDEAIQERIFEPFFTTKELGKGTGLGLSTVYGIVKQSGGNIWVYSEVGKGTTFKVYLPRFDEASEAAWERDAELEWPQGSETVLLVEDEEMVREMTRQILEMHGYRVLEANNGKEAIRLCHEHEGRIDLVMTDVVMPQMGGRELIERLAPLLPEAKVLYMSGYTDDAIVHHGVLDESMYFLQKPFSPDVLINKVREALDA
ncbi:MAG TPA: PAS domain S-box protein [Pyrinomonadaceae bacterium]